MHKTGLVMPSVKKISLKLETNSALTRLSILADKLKQEVSSQSSLFTPDERSVLLRDNNLALNWLTSQEINTVTLCTDQDTSYKVLIHRIRFSLFPAYRIPTKLPAYLLVEPTSVCNLRCPMCFQTDKSFTTSGYMGKMSLELFKNITTEADMVGIGALTLASRGEPLLHPDIIDMLEHVKDKFIEKKINTNATRR